MPAKDIELTPVEESIDLTKQPYSQRDKAVPKPLIYRDVPQASTFSVVDIWEALPYSDTPLYSSGPLRNELLPGTGIESYYDSQSNMVRNINSKISYTNSYVGAICKACTYVTAPVGLFTSTVEGTYTGDYLTGALGTVAGFGNGQIGFAVDNYFMFSGDSLNDIIK
ncbi:hypothetical protein G8764_16810 [Pseudomaricurvus alcaniphilus]|uniref:hypothetical protein n=1 Tax=Pseudomaricurvus alcaniphilus TaxID=1166482 RepID=UPI00140797EF|nr:hypothetical protein [Pseudomaricurvus alcaniphilus]NHN38972.1 hypothetical protein [Pseudomaricurvus alcaniphilus]